MHLNLYHTSGCHLCELAEQVIAEVQALGQWSLMINKIDIADSDALLAQYGMRIPVLKAVATQAALDWPFAAPELLAYLVEISAASPGD